MNKYIIILSFLLLISNYGYSQIIFSSWTDSVYSQMTIEERVAQILIAKSDNVITKKKEIVFPGFYTSSDNKRCSNNKVADKSHPFLVRDIYDFENEFLFKDILKYINPKLYANYKSIIINNDDDGVLLPSYLYNKLYKSSKIRYRPIYYMLINGESTKEHLYVYNLPSRILEYKGGRKEVNPREYLVNNNLIVDYDNVSVENLLSPGVVFYTNNYKKDLNLLAKSFSRGRLSEEQLEAACKFVLQIKYNSQLEKNKNINLDCNLLIENSIGFFQLPDRKTLPFTDLDINIKFIDERGAKNRSFYNSLNRYYSNFNENKLVDYNIYLMDDESTIDYENYFQALNSSTHQGTNILLWTGEFENFPIMNPFLYFESVLAAPASSDFIWDRLAQALFSGISIENKNYIKEYPEYLRKFASELSHTRLKYGLPEEVGLTADTLMLIDSIMHKVIAEKATPGGQVFVVKDGVVAYNKSFGTFSYSDKKKVDESAIYDLASITKIAATVPMLISLYDEGRWRFNNVLGDYFQLEDTCEKKDITIRELLMHESGLNSFIPFYQMLFDTTKINGNLFSRRKTLKYSIQVDKRLYMNNTIAYNNEFISKNKNESFSYQIANNMFLRNDFQDSIISKVFKSSLKRKSYLYSDLNFILLEKIASQIANCSIDQYIDSVFFKSLGAKRLTYNPISYFNVSEIVPTEIDKFFRYQEIRGYVHDQGAAMMGGVAGHAGLFGNANDLAKLLQMYLNNGVYGGKRYLNSETVKFFTSKQNDKNRRGLGFDKPEMLDRKNGPTGIYTSASSYGHTGFTGTIAWVDPEYNLIYIFLSNRISPNTYNTKLLESNVRTEIQDVIYRSIMQKMP